MFSFRVGRALSLYDSIPGCFPFLACSYISVIFTKYVEYEVSGNIPNGSSVFSPQSRPRPPLSAPIFPIIVTSGNQDSHKCFFSFSAWRIWPCLHRRITPLQVRLPAMRGFTCDRASNYTHAYLYRKFCVRTLSRFVALSKGRVMFFFLTVLVVLLEVNTLVLAAIISVDLTIGQSHAA